MKSSEWGWGLHNRSGCSPQNWDGVDTLKTRGGQCSLYNRCGVFALTTRSEGCSLQDGDGMGSTQEVMGAVLRMGRGLYTYNKR